MFHEHYHNNLKRDLIDLFPELLPTTAMPELSKIILQHTSRTVLLNKHNILPVMWAFICLTNQKPYKILAKHSAANWQLRENDLVGCLTTLRGDALFHFLLKYIFIYLPKTTQSSHICVGNTVSFGILDLLLFDELEVHYDMYREVFLPKGLHFNVCVQNSSNSLLTCALLKGFLLPVHTNTPYGT